MLIKHEYPVLEYDTDTSAVIAPTHEGLELKLPKCAVFAFLGDCVDSYAAEKGLGQLGVFDSETRDYPLYLVKHRGVEVVLCQAPVGAAAATQILDWLIGYGVRSVISAGACGALGDFGENELLIPTRALRDEGTSYKYLPPSRFAEVNSDAVDAVEKAVAHRGLKAKKVTTWSTDGFYRETKAMVAYRKAEGCEAVEMECSALAACAEMRNAAWGCLLYTADTLFVPDAYDERDWGNASRRIALEICLDAVVELQKRNTEE